MKTKNILDLLILIQQITLNNLKDLIIIDLHKLINFQ